MLIDDLVQLHLYRDHDSQEIEVLFLDMLKARLLLLIVQYQKKKSFMLISIRL